MKLTYTITELTNDLGEKRYTIYRKEHWVGTYHVDTVNTWEDALQVKDKDFLYRRRRKIVSSVVKLVSRETL